MKPFRVALTTLLAVLGVGSVQAVTGSVTAAESTSSACPSAGTIPVTSIPSRVALRTCPIQGRQLAIRLPNGQPGPGLYVPPPEVGIGDAVLTTNGEYVLTAVNSKGYVTIHWSAPGTHATQTRAASAAKDPACNENAFNLEGPSWMNTGTPTDIWYYNESTASRAGLSVSKSESDIRQANTNMTRGINNCNLPGGRFDVQGAFKGNTSKFANVTSQAKCSSRFPDGQNTVSFAPFTMTGTLAATCFGWKITVSGSREMTEADTQIGSNRKIVDTFPSRCTNSFDLQSIMTHEWGHAYGLAHETSGPDEVMYPFSRPCVLRRHLGGGDWSGMDSLYPSP